MNEEKFLEKVKFDSNGLVSVIAQDYMTKNILMLAYANRETLKESLQTGKMTYWSRSRKKRWQKGEESGNVQLIKEVYIDCDGDAVLVRVEQIGGASCHVGYDNCFYRMWDKEDFKITGTMMFDPKEKYGKK